MILPLASRHGAPEASKFVGLQLGRGLRATEHGKFERMA